MKSISLDANKCELQQKASLIELEKFFFQLRFVCLSHLLLSLRFSILALARGTDFSSFFFLLSFLFRYFWNGADFWRLIKQTFLPSYLAVTQDPLTMASFNQQYTKHLHQIKAKKKKRILAFKTMPRVVYTYAPNLSNENLKSKKSFENLFWARVFFIENQVFGSFCHPLDFIILLMRWNSGN